MTIYPSELAGLLALLWLPVFALAGIVQWRLLRNRRRRLLWIIAGLPLEIVLAFGIWVSPIHPVFIPLAFLVTRFNIPGSLSFYSIPLQAAVLASVIVTVVFWWMGRARESRVG